MACCLMAPSHFLNQCCLIISVFSDNHLRAISQKKTSATKLSLNMTSIKFHSNLSGSNEPRLFCILLLVISWLTHWGWVQYICIGNLTIIGSDNGLLPGLCQAIIWTIAGMLLIWTLGTNFNEILSEVHTFSFKKVHLKMSRGQHNLLDSLVPLLNWYNMVCTQEFIQIHSGEIFFNVVENWSPKLLPLENITV